MVLKKYFGIIKFYQGRIGSYLGIVNAINIMLILSNVYDVSFLLISFVVTIIMVFVAFIDHTSVNQADIDFWLNRSKSFRDLCKNQKKIMKVLNVKDE